MALIHSGLEDAENSHPKGVPEFYLHNLYGLQQTKLINEILIKN
jgi:hypothetical protein